VGERRAAMLARGDNGKYQIFQAPGYVAIMIEMIHECGLSL